MPEEYLLDTCVFLWASSAPDALTPRVRAVLEDAANELYFSSASGWEILGKAAKGKLSLGNGEPTDLLRQFLAQLGVRVVPIRMDHLYTSYRLPRIHNDPIDRILVGQALEEHMTLITPDQEIQKYGVRTLWK